MANKKNSDKISGIRQKTHDGVDKIMDKTESLRDSGKEAIAGLKEKGIKMKKNVDGYIKKNPEKSVLIAAATGAAVGAALVAVMRKKR